MAAKNTGITVARISVKVSPDTDDFGRDLRRSLKRISDTTKVSVEAVPDASKFREKLEAATRGKGGKVSVEVDVDRRTLGKLTDRVSDSVANIKPPSVAAGGGGMAPGLGGIAQVAAIAAAAVLAIGPVMGLVSSALVSLPGMIAAVAVPIGALALGMDGLKKAAERLAQPFEDLKATMSSKVEGQFGPVFDKLGAIFPMLKAALPSVTQGMADLAQSFADTVTSSGGMAKIQSIIGNIGTALSAAGPGVSSFTNGMLTLAQQFSEKLPAISGWFNDIGTRFSAWVDKMAASGTLSAAFDGLGSTLKTLVDGLAGLAAEGLKFFENPENIKNFNAVLSNLAAGLRDVVAISNQLSGVWSAIAFLTTPTSQAAESVGNAFIGMKAKISDAWNSAKAAVAEGVASVVGFVAGLPGQILGAVGDLSGTLVAAGQALMDGLLSGIKAAWENVKTFVSGIAGWIAANKGPIPYDKTVLIPNGQALMEGLGKGLETGFQPVLDQAKGMAEQIADVFSTQPDLWDAISGAGDKSIQAGLDLMAAPVQQFTSDLGIGGGALSALAEEGWNYGKQAIGDTFNFAVSGVDEAMSIKDREVSKRARTLVGR